MTIIIIILFVTFASIFNKVYGNVLCDNNWISYENKKCIKVVKVMTSHSSAEEVCSRLDRSSMLLTIHSQKENDFILNLLKPYESQTTISVWLGTVFKDQIYHWVDSSPLNFQNWFQGYPISGDITKHCSLLLLSNTNAPGYWINEDCNTNSLIVCQYIPEHPSYDTESELLFISDKIKKLDNDLSERIKIYDLKIKEMSLTIKAEIDATRELLKYPVPIGYIHIQYPNNEEPSKLSEQWSKLKWTDVTEDYGGVFFRVLGGNSAAFEEIQESNSSSVDWIRTRTMNGIKYRNSHNSKDHILREENWMASNQLVKGAFVTNFYRTDGSDHPINTAIKLWKHTA